MVSCIKQYNKSDMRKLWLVLVFLLIISQAVNADSGDPNTPNDPNSLTDPNAPCDSNDPSELLYSKWNAIIPILQNKDIDQKAKEEKIHEIVSPYFDFPLMSKLALGKKHWSKFTPSQRERFICLFTDRLKTSYGNKVSLYEDEKVFIKPRIRKKNSVYIPTELVSKDKKLDVLYKFRKVEKSWKIYDVEIEGVSVLLTYRSQFDDILSQSTIEELLSRLEHPPDS